MASGKKKAEKTHEPVVPIEVKAEGKEAIPTTPVEEVHPLPVTLKEVAKGTERRRRLKEPKEREIPPKKVEVKFPRKEDAA